MGFSKEMKDFISAMSAGQKMNASRTDQEYKEAQTARTKATTERENDPETLKTAAEQARANLDKTRQGMSLAGAASGRASTLMGDRLKTSDIQRQILQERLRQERAAGTGGGLGLANDGYAPTPGQGALPVPAQPGLPASTLDTEEDAYAEGGAVPTEEERERGKERLKRRFDENTATRRGDDAWYKQKYMGDQMSRDMRYSATIEDDLEADRKGRSRAGNMRMNSYETGFADGGLVPDEDEDAGGVLDTSPEPAAATPTNAPTDVSARAREPRVPKGLEGVISPALVADATKAGMTFLARESGLANPGAIRSPRTMAAARAIAQGAGGLSEQEMQAAKKMIDPEGKLTDSQRNMAALGSVYQFYANKGEPQKAEKVAAQMLQYYRGASQRYAAIAAKAAEGGNIDLATKAALKAYQNVPDGNDLEILPNPDGGLMYAVTGPNGEVVTKGIATPQQLAASAMGLATGGFDKAILSAAGARETPKGAVGGKPQSASDRAKEAETVGGELEKMKSAWQAKNKDTPVDEEHWSQIASGAQHLYQANPKATPGEVARAAQALFSPGTKDPEKPDFKLTPGEEGAPSKIKFNNGLSLEVDDGMVDQIMNARAMIAKRAQEAMDKKMTEEETPGFASRAAGAVDTIAGGVKKFADEGGVTGAIGGAAKAVGGKALDALRAVYGQHIPQSIVDAVQRAGNVTTGAAEDAVGDASDLFKNRGAIPVDANDRPL